MMLIHEVRAASTQTATWLANLLEPAAKASKMLKPPAVELRPTGAWAGWCASPDAAPDGRVCLSKAAPTLWTSQSIVCVWLHEASHRFLFARPVAGGSHDAAFYATLLLLSMRCDAAGVTKSAALQLASYDLQDVPLPLCNLSDRGLGRAIGWATSVALELMESPLTAEDAALEIASRYAAWLHELDGEPAALAARKALAARQQRQHEAVVSELKNRIFNRTLALALTGLFAFALIAVLVKLS